jgi:hypothetical protein
MKNKTFLLVLLAAFSMTMSAQITGTVLDASTAEPIIGANIIEKGTVNGTITDFDGNFSLSNVKPGQYLQISYIGYKTYELRVAATTTSYNVTLQEDAEQLDEVVVVGYGAQKKVNLTGAVSVVTAEEVSTVIPSVLVWSITCARTALSVA